MRSELREMMSDGLFLRMLAVDAEKRWIFDFSGEGGIFRTHVRRMLVSHIKEYRPEMVVMHEFTVGGFGLLGYDGMPTECSLFGIPVTIPQGDASELLVPYNEFMLVRGLAGTPSARILSIIRKGDE